MKTALISSIIMLTAATVFGQNSVSISQTGGTGNQASVTQTGEGNSVSISQRGGAGSDDSKPGNRVSLRVPKGTETTINQRSEGPNAVEISQEGRSTATISQSSGTNENAVTTLPDTAPSIHRNRPAKRRNRRS